MKRILLAFVAIVWVLSASCQSVTRAYKLKSTNFGNQRIEAYVSNGDTTYCMHFKTTNRYQTYFPVSLGRKDDAVRILNFLLETEIRGDDVIDLENETKNYVKKNTLGGYLVYSEGGTFSQQLLKKNIKSFISAIEEFCSSGKVQRPAYARHMDDD